MKRVKVKDIMIPLEEYDKINQNSLLIEAINTLEIELEKYDKTHYSHRALIVVDDEGKIVGKLSQWDVVRGLEPKYEYFTDQRSMSGSGLSQEMVSSMMESFDLWQGDLDTLCNRVANKKIKDYMYEPTEGEKVDENETLGKALHIFVTAQHKSILVTRNGEIVGILRLVDIFKIVADKIKSCAI